MRDLIGGQIILGGIAWILLSESFLIAVLQAGNAAHPASRESITLFWFALLLVASRLVIRVQLHAQMFSWWGNICWLALTLATARLLYEHWTGRPVWPAKDRRMGIEQRRSDAHP